MPGNDKLYGCTAIITVTPLFGATNPLVGVGFNFDRIGAIVYNNSANSIYMAYGTTVSSANFMTVIIPTFTQWTMLSPIYLGPLAFTRNAGSGNVLITEILLQTGRIY